MCPKKVLQFVNVANPLVISVYSDGNGITCSTHDVFHVRLSVLP